MIDVIGLHAHAVMREPFGMAGEYGPALDEDDGPAFRVGSYVKRPARYPNSVFTEPTLRLDVMDQIGISHQMVSPNPLTFFSGIEAERAAALGLHVVYIGTGYGAAMDDPSLDQFYATLVALNLPLFIHPATNNGRDAAHDQRLHRFGLDPIVGYTYEETVTVATGFSEECSTDTPSSTSVSLTVAAPLPI